MPTTPLSRAAVSRTSSTSVLEKGTYHALIIGVSKYTYQQSLEFPVKDARKMEQILKRNYHFEAENIHFLENPERDDILNQLDQLTDQLQEQDYLLIFYAGHGHWEERSQRGYWLPCDARLNRRAAWISNATLQDYLRGMASQHILVISDTCFSGALLLQRSAIEDAGKAIETLLSAKSRKALTSGVREEVPDRSIFFRELSRFLRQNQQEYLSASELYAGIRNKIIQHSPSGQHPQFGAIAHTGDEGGDFIFVKKMKRRSSKKKPSHPMDKLRQQPFVRERLQALKKQLDEEIPVKTLNQNLLIASWNIRKFGGNDYGGRSPEAMAYIASIIERFDIVAVQELYGDLGILDELKSYLGDHWNYLFSDTSIGFGGEDYRLGYFYDTRTVNTGGITSDLILPSIRSRDEQGRFVFKPATQLLRPPFNCGFRMEDRRLILCNIHLVFGRRQHKSRRLKELENVLEYWKWRTGLKNVWSKNVLLLGNLQTEKLSAPEFYRLKDSIFEQSEATRVPSNLTRTRYYNQMAFHFEESAWQLSGKGGAFNFFESVYRKRDEKHYASQMGKHYSTDEKGQERTDSKKRLFYQRFWRTSQLSDNLPLWVELLW